eukprot:jgi/Picre1/34267/NNA_001741.t1
MSLKDVVSNLRAEIETAVDSKPMVKVHAKEWEKIMQGKPVEINPSLGHGFKIMSVDEWAARWKTNEEFAECLNCGSTNTKEHAFTQTWCRGKKKWDSECLCLDCICLAVDSIVILISRHQRSMRRRDGRSWF